MINLILNCLGRQRWRQALSVLVKRVTVALITCVLCVFCFYFSFSYFLSPLSSTHPQTSRASSTCLTHLSALWCETEKDGAGDFHLLKTDMGWEEAVVTLDFPSSRVPHELLHFYGEKKEELIIYSEHFLQIGVALVHRTGFLITREHVHIAYTQL